MRLLSYEDAGSDGPAVGSGGSFGGTAGSPILKVPKYLDAKWNLIKEPLKAVHKGFRLVLFVGNNPDDTSQYLFPPVELGPSERRYVFTMSMTSSVVVNCAIKTLYKDWTESGWSVIASGVLVDPVTVATGGGAYDIRFQKTGKPAAAEAILTFPVTTPFTMAATGHSGTCTANPTATANLPVKKNGTTVGTLQVSTSGVLSLVGFSSTAFAAGDILTVEAPATQDATYSGLFFVLKTNI